MNDAITIYHDPQCGSSRNTLALLRANGVEPRIVLHLQTPRGTRLCRPPTLVLDLLGTPPRL